MVKIAEIIDSHIHFFLSSALTDPSRWANRYSAEQIRLMRERFAKNLQARGQPPMDVSLKTPADYARRWLEELDRHGISRGVFFSLDPDTEPFRQFISYCPERFIPYAYVNPLDPQAPIELRRQVAAFGARGLKLVATTQWFHAYDERIYPFWQEVGKLRLPVLIHCGASIGYMADFRYADPLDLQPVLRDFPEVPFLLAHFGAGFFREALLLCYQSDNLYLDTSSSNIWMKYQSHHMTIKDVFDRALDAAGPGRLIFGTDSSYFPRGFRRDILDEQLEALDALGCSDGDMALILGGNLKRLLGETI